MTRTLFNRAHLLRRLLTSITRASVPEVDVEIVLSTDVPMDSVIDEVDQLRADFPDLAIRLVVNHGTGHSRVNNMIGGIRAAEGDYVWLIDDDDYVDLFAFEKLRRHLFLKSRPLIFAGAMSRKETWNTSSPDHPVLVSSSPGAFWPANGWRHLFGGSNQVPICGAIVPREFLWSCLNQFEFRFDLSEDYALFLLLLTSPMIPTIVEQSHVCSHISIRDAGENTVTVSDRSGWTRDILGFLHDLVNRTEGRSGGQWSVLTGVAARLVNIDGEAEIPRLRESVVERDRQIVALQRQIEYLQETIENGGRSQ